MKEEMITFIQSQKIGVLAVQLLDGYPHASAMHFAFHEESFSFIFLTSSHYKKCEPLKENGSAHASFVVGVSEEEMKTAQLDGELTFIDNDKLESYFFEVFPDKKDKHPDDILLVFTPHWWRYTDWTKPEGKTILTDEGEIIVVK